MSSPRLLPLALSAAFLATSAFAQLQAPTPIEEIDPDVQSAAEVEAAPTARPAARAAEPRPALPQRPSAPPLERAAGIGTERSAPLDRAAPAQRARPPPPPILAPRRTNADLQAAWERWRKAWASLDVKAAERAQQELLALKQEIGATDLEAFGVGFVRAAQKRAQANDLAAANQLAEAGVALAPDLPYTRLALAQIYAQADPVAAGRYLREVRAALGTLATDARYRRPVLADLGAMALLALLATAVAAVGMLFARKARYLLHDFHHLFPRAAAPWQSAALALLILSLPLVFRLGLVPVLLTLFAASALYLSTRERALAAGLLTLVGLVPLGAGELARSTAFAGTVAEDVYLLERGGLAAEEASARVRLRHDAQSSTFPELFALARFEARRGELDLAIAHYKAAATLRSGDARLLTNLGNALLASGDPDGAAQLYINASQADPSLPAPYFNLAQVHRRRAKVAGDDAVGLELEKANTALTTAQRLDERLLHRGLPPDDRLLMNLLLLSPGLPEEELEALGHPVEGADRIQAQLALSLAGSGSAGPWSWVYPALAALALFFFGATGRSSRAARACEKCGMPVCRKCDPELGPASSLCAQCVNVFTRKGLVAPQMKLRKQLEVVRHKARMSRIAYALGLLVSGAGHLFSGLPVRGAIYTFFFLFAVVGVIARQGVLRGPYGDVPIQLKLLPLLLLLVPVYLMSLRGLYKRQTE